MKIVTAKEMARIERLAYAQGATEEVFMNRAGQGVAELLQKIVTRDHLKPRLTLLCGAGNNAGDAFVAGQLLRQAGWEVHALALAPFEKCSPLNQLQNQRFKSAGGIVHDIHSENEIQFYDPGVIVDGILGTGFHGEVQGLIKTTIERANALGTPLIAIDIPSGINGTTGEVGSVAICACETLFLGLPKIGCFYKEPWNYVGKVHTYNFGLDCQFVEQADAEAFLIDEEMMIAFLPKMVRSRHKYQAGYVVGIGGTKGMPGAPIMASFAALRAGAGIVRLLHPVGMENELSAAPCEVIRQGYHEGDVKTVIEAAKRASALFIGPGMGTSHDALTILRGVLTHVEKPIVIDAEALTLIAEHEIQLPEKVLMTPHQGEMKRLLKITEEISFQELLTRSAEYAEKNQVTLLLKGPPTYIFQPGNTPYVMARGDPGMATAGSGDVLTGIAAAFLAQTQDPFRAAVLGSYFHAAAGEHAAEKWGSSSMVATDITAALPLVFKSYKGSNYKRYDSN